MKCLSYLIKHLSLIYIYIYIYIYIKIFFFFFFFFFIPTSFNFLLLLHDVQAGYKLSLWKILFPSILSAQKIAAKTQLTFLSLFHTIILICYYSTLLWLDFSWKSNESLCVLKPIPIPSFMSWSLRHFFLI